MFLISRTVPPRVPPSMDNRSAIVSSMASVRHYKCVLFVLLFVLDELISSIGRIKSLSSASRYCSRTPCRNHFTTFLILRWCSFSLLELSSKFRIWDDHGPHLFTQLSNLLRARTIGWGLRCSTCPPRLIVELFSRREETPDHP